MLQLQVKILTSRSDRAIVSAQAMLRGLFPANNTIMQWLEDEKWQPISFHSESTGRNAPVSDFPEHPSYCLIVYTALATFPSSVSQIHILSFQLLHSTLHFCSRYIQLMENETAVIADAMMQKYADLVDLLANVTGIGERLSFGRIAGLIDIQREV